MQLQLGARKTSQKNQLARRVAELPCKTAGGPILRLRQLAKEEHWQQLARLQQPVPHRVHQAVHRQRLALVPGLLHYGAGADVEDLVGARGGRGHTHI